MSYESTRPFADFLLPSLPSIFRSRGRSLASAAEPRPISSEYGSHCDDAQMQQILQREAKRPSIRDSVASTSSSSSAATTSTRCSSGNNRSNMVPSLSASPNSITSTFGSLSSTNSDDVYSSSALRMDENGTVFQVSTGLVSSIWPAAESHLGLDFRPFESALDKSEPQCISGDHASATTGLNDTFAADGSCDAGSDHGTSSPTCLTTSSKARQQHQQQRKPHRPHRVKRMLPDTLRCVECSADIAFAAQIVSKGFMGRHGRAYLVSAPATSPAHLFAPEASARRPAKDSPICGSNLANIRVGIPENRQLVTGAHVVADISCAICNTKLGWKYINARDATQRYKVGKFILELARVTTYHSWEDEEDEGDAPGAAAAPISLFPPHRPTTATDLAMFALETADVDSVDAARALMAKMDLEEESDAGDLDDSIAFDSEDEEECEEIFSGTWDADVVAKRRRKKMIAAVTQRAA